MMQAKQLKGKLVELARLPETNARGAWSLEIAHARGQKAASVAICGVGAIGGLESVQSLRAPKTGLGAASELPAL